MTDVIDKEPEQQIEQTPRDHYNMVLGGLLALQKFEDVLKYYEEYKEIGDDLSYYAAIAYDALGKFPEAIEQYELALKYIEDFTIYCNLYRLYAEVYLFDKADKQLYYAQKAYEMNPNSQTAIANMLICRGRFGLPCDEYYEMLKKFKPEPIISFVYGCIQIREGNYELGFKLYRHRFEYDPKALPAGLQRVWQPGIDISDKTILVTYEQGFGDTLMFFRFLKYLKCKKIKVLVQQELYDLIKPNTEYDLYSTADMYTIQYDYFLPMMDLPVVTGLTREKICQKDGYLTVPQEKIDAYKEITSDKIKIGICFSGNKEGKVTCRDIPLKDLYPLFELPNTQFYCFQKQDLNKEIPDVPEKYNLINLGPSFNTWEDTACAMKHLDLMISTDNGVFNLAGALGVKTYGLFNKYPEFRWFDMKDTVGWYNIKPFQCTEFNKWEEPVTKLKEQIIKDFNLG